MKYTVRILSVLFVLALCLSTMAACGGTTSEPTTNAPATTAQPTTEATEASQPFVAPPDQMGLVISADTELVTWQVYATEGDTIDFKGIDVKKLDKPADMSLFYLEDEVTYYSLVSGKLEEASIYDVVVGSVIGITTLEEGVQEVYILSVPAEESFDEEDPLSDFVEETIPAETQSPDYDTPPDEDITDEETDDVI